MNDKDIKAMLYDIKDRIGFGAGAKGLVRFAIPAPVIGTAMVGPIAMAASGTTISAPPKPE